MFKWPFLQIVIAQFKAERKKCLAIVVRGHIAITLTQISVDTIVFQWNFIFFFSATYIHVSLEKWFLRSLFLKKLEKKYFSSESVAVWSFKTKRIVCLFWLLYSKRVCLFYFIWSWIYCPSVRLFIRTSIYFVDILAACCLNTLIV